MQLSRPRLGQTPAAAGTFRDRRLRLLWCSLDAWPVSMLGLLQGCVFSFDNLLFGVRFHLSITESVDDEMEEA